MRKSLLALAVAALCLTLTYLLLVKPSKGVTAGKFRIRYGQDERQFVDLYLKGNDTWLVFVVHGGGYRGGSATGKSAKALASPFLGRYSVALVEYRVCPQVKWPTPVEDVAEAIRYTIAYLESRNVRIRGSVYVGSSAGAITGALLIYGPRSEDYGVWKYFRGYIGISGGYCLSVYPERRLEGGNGTFDLCNVSLKEVFPFDDFDEVRDVPALLIAGNEDRLLDGMADGTVNHQAECFSRKVKRVTKIYVNGGHIEPIRLLYKGDSKIRGTIEKFMSEVTGYVP